MARVTTSVAWTWVLCFQERGAAYASGCRQARPHGVSVCVRLLHVLHAISMHLSSISLPLCLSVLSLFSSLYCSILSLYRSILSICCFPSLSLLSVSVSVSVSLSLSPTFAACALFCLHFCRCPARFNSLTPSMPRACCANVHGALHTACAGGACMHSFITLPQFMEVVEMMAARNHDRTREIINGFRLFDKTGFGPCTACCTLYNYAAACLRCVRAFAANPCCPTRPYWCLLGPSTILGVLLCALRSNPMFI